MGTRFYRNMFLFFLHLYIGVELLGLIITLCSFEELPNFSKWLHHFTFSPAGVSVLVSLHSYQHLLCLPFLSIVSLVDGR